METPNLEQADIIGSGLFGIVKRETINQGDLNSIRVARKILNIKKVNNKINQKVEEEIKIIKKRIQDMNNLVKKNLENCNITKYYDDITDEDGKLSFKMEL